MNTTDFSQKEFLIKLGNKIRDIRLQKGLSQADVANICGKERQSYQRVEKGNINPTVWYLQHIACALDISLSELLDVDFDKIKL
jgi:putative transcriptional regulator